MHDVHFMKKRSPNLSKLAPADISAEVPCFQKMKKEWILMENSFLKHQLNSPVFPMVFFNKTTLILQLVSTYISWKCNVYKVYGGFKLLMSEFWRLENPSEKQKNVVMKQFIMKWMLHNIKKVFYPLWRVYLGARWCIIYRWFILGLPWKSRLHVKMVYN